MGGYKYAADIDSITKVQDKIKAHIHVTPVLSSASLNSIAGNHYILSANAFKRAFKFRGALNAVLSLDEEEAAKGVVTHSSGNHAAALSLAAQIRGIPAYVVVPKNAPKCKVENVKHYGGQVVFSEPNMKSREETATKVSLERGAVLIPSSNDARIISGQSTLALEFLNQVPKLDTLIVPISGGLTFGTVIGAKAKNPAIRVFAAEPKGADDAAKFIACGRLVTLSQTNTIADGLRASLRDLIWTFVRDLFDAVITVEDKEIVEATRYCYQILKVAIEPSAAIGLAAVLSDNFKKISISSYSRSIGIVLSGGNADLGVLFESWKN